MQAGHAAQITTAQYVENVFNYVRNNIEVEFTFGLSKGARGALIDQYGSPFDQAELMVDLLRAGGVTAQYQIGTITLTGRQFGYWTGLVRDLAAPSAGLDPYTAAGSAGAQAFSVEARSACQLLADGGIPAVFSGGATCGALSGNLSATSTAVTLAHVWVVANGQNYNPSLKLHTLTPRMNLPALMGCGSWLTTSTCGAPTSQVLTGATVGTYGGATSITGISQTNWNTSIADMGPYRIALQHGLESQDRFLQVTEAVGGMTLYAAAAATNVATTYTASASWAGDVPDAYRTKMVVRTPLFIPCTYFADEIAGRRLVFSGVGDQSTGLIDGSTCNNVGGASAPAGHVLINIDHPYFANSRTYADELIDLELVEAYGAVEFEVDGEGDYWGDNNAATQQNMVGSFPITIVHGFGAAAASAQQQMSALQDVSPISGSCQPSGGGVISRTCQVGNSPLIAETIRYQETLLNTMVAGVTRTGIVRHHDVGIILSSRNVGSSYISMSTATSVVNSRADDAGARDRAFEIMGQLLPELEEASVAVEPFSDDRHPEVGPRLPVSGVSQLVEVLPAQMATFLTALPSTSSYANFQVWETRRRARLQTAAGLGYTSVLNVTGDIWTGEFFYKAGDRNYTLWQALKGANIDDPLRATMNMAQISDAAAPRRRYASVSPSDGELSFTAPADIVTGAGAFPYSLDFRRTYVPGAQERVDAQRTTYMSGQNQVISNAQTWIYTGVDQDSAARLGGGWTHNFNITATTSVDYSRMLGSVSAIEGSGALATIVALNDLATPATLQDRVRLMSLRRSMFPAWQRTFVVKRGASSEAFLLLPDWRLSSPPGSSARLTIPSVSVGETLQPNLTYIGPEGDVIYFDDFTRRKYDLCVGGSPQTPREPLYRAAYWAFPSGVRIDFDYQILNFWTNVPEQIDQCQRSYSSVLTGVHNNLGRSLSFTNVAYDSGIPTYYNDGSSFGVGAVTVGYRLSAVTDENSRSVSFGVSSCPTGARIVCNVFTVTDPTSAVTRYEYAADANSPDPSIILRPNYRLRRYFTPEQVAAGGTPPFETIRYDGMFRVARVTDALGAATLYYPGAIAGDEEWRRSQIVSPLSIAAAPVVTTNIFDGHNALLQSIDPLGRSVRNEYDRAQRLVRTTNPEGDQTVRSYDVRSNVTEIRRISKTPGTPADIVTTTAFAPSCGISGQPACGGAEYFWANCVSTYTSANCNRPLRDTDARGYVSAYTWDSASGMLTRVDTGLNAGLTCTLAGGTCPRTDLVYSLFGTGAQFRLLTQRTDRISVSDNLVTSYGYNAANHFVLSSAIVDPSGLNISTGFTFDAIGNVTQINGPRTDVTDVTDVTWDLDRRIRFRIEADPDGAGGNPRPAVRLTYNLGGLLLTNESGTTTSATGSNFSAAQTTSFAYDGVGRRIRATSPAGVTQIGYDAADRTICTAVRMNPAVYGSLPSDACALSTQGANGPDRITHMVYDAAGQVLNEQRAYATALQQNYSTFAYTLNGQPDWVEDANGNRSNYTYDGFDRLSQLNFPSTTMGAHAASATDFEQYAYDASSNRVSVTLRSGQLIGRTFDALNRETFKNWPGGGTGDVSSTYDLLGRRLSAHFSVGDIDYTYDRPGRLLTESAYGRVLSYQYDQAGNRTRLTWPDANYVQYTYDAMNRMDQVRENGATSGLGLLADYSYDTLGRRATIVRGNGTSTTIAYDAASRLQSLTQDVLSTGQDLALGFSYNPASQVLSRSLSNDAYRWAAPAANRAYVRNGLNQYTSVGGAAFSYDARGNLTNDGVRGFSYDLENHLTGVTGVPAPVTLAYDPLGRLRQSTAAGVSTDYLFDGDRLTAEYNGATMLRRYVHGAGVDEPLVWYEGANLATRNWLHADHQGSVIATTIGTGAASIYAYGPYGEPANDNWTGSRFRYTGQIALPEARLYHYKSRVYDPALGRFLQTDPVGYRASPNLYGYVDNNPINSRDPSGLYKCVLDKDACRIIDYDRRQLLADSRLVRDQTRSAARALDSHQRLTADQQATVDAFKKHFGRDPTSASLRAAANGLDRIIDFWVDSGPAFVRPANSRHGYDPNEDEAYVVRGDRSGSVYIVSQNYYDSGSRAATLFHETTHKLFGAGDYAYSWQDGRFGNIYGPSGYGYLDLTPEQRWNNADSWACFTFTPCD
ncbi:MAG: RHS repeat-associated core domain-containing protein [Terricaulis sp.]